MYCSLVVIRMIMMDGASSMTREVRLPSLLCHLSAQTICLFLMPLCLMKSQSSSILMAPYGTLWHLMAILVAPYGTLCSERYLNFTKQYSSLRFIIFIIFCIALPQILGTKQLFSVQMYFDARDGVVGRS